MINKKYFISIFCGLFIQGCDGKETSSPVNAQLNTTITGCTITQPSDVPKSYCQIWCMAFRPLSLLIARLPACHL